MHDELSFKTIAALAALMRTREVSPVEVTEAFLRRIESLDNQLDAFITVKAELARRQARVAETEIMGGSYRGPLHGIPFGLMGAYFNEAFQRYRTMLSGSAYNLGRILAGFAPALITGPM